MRLAIFVLLLAGTQWCASQDCHLSITGRVIDRATREPLEFTTVELAEYKTGVIADSLGQFVFHNICPGPVHINFHHIGCPVEGLYINLTRDTVILFQLAHHGELLREVRIEGEQEASGNVQSITRTAELHERPHASLAELASTISGVTMIQNGSGISKPIIHGLYGNRVAVINNGVIQAGQQWGADHAPEVDPFVADHIVVVKGSDAIEYGSQAMGGAIRLEPGVIAQDPHWHGDLMYGLESNGRAHSLAFKGSKSFSKTDFRVMAGYKRAGDHSSPRYFLTNTGASEWSGAGQATYRRTERMHHHFFYSAFHAEPGIFAGAHVSNLSDLEQAIGSAMPFNINPDFSYQINPPRQSVTHHLGKYSGRRFTNENTSLEWMYAAQYNHRREYDIRRGDRSTIPALDLKLWNHSLEIKRSTEGSHMNNRTGVQFRFADNYNSFDTGILPLIPDYKEGYAGVFTAVDIPGKEISWNAGARYDLHVLKAWAIASGPPPVVQVRNHHWHEGAIAAGIRYAPDDHLETRMLVVGARRSPAPNELYSFGLHQGIAGVEEGDWALKPETSVKAIIDQKISLHQVAHVFVTAYAHRIDDYIYLRPDPELRLTIRGAFPVYRYTQEDALIRGLDVLVVSDFSHRLEWTGKAAFIRGTRLAEETHLAQMPPTQLTSSLSWTFKDSRQWKSVKFNVEIVHAAEQKHWDEAAELLAPPKAYTLVNAGFSTGLVVGDNMLYGSLAVENLFDIQYRNYLNRLRYFADEEGRNVRAVLRYEF